MFAGRLDDRGVGEAEVFPAVAAAQHDDSRQYQLSGKADILLCSLYYFDELSVVQANSAMRSKRGEEVQSSEQG